MKISIYTDGSCTPNPGLGGAAALVVINDIEVAGRRAHQLNTTNSEMELKAIELGLLELGAYLYKNPPVPDLVQIVSDSTYAIGVVKGDLRAKVHIPLITRIRSKIRILRSIGTEVEIVHVKGHSGDEFNERVHILAKSME